MSNKPKPVDHLSAAQPETITFTIGFGSKGEAVPVTLEFPPSEGQWITVVDPDGNDYQFTLGRIVHRLGEEAGHSTICPQCQQHVRCFHTYIAGRLALISIPGHGSCALRRIGPSTQGE